MPRLSPLVYTLQILAFTGACQATVNLTEGSATNTENSTGGTTTTNNSTTGAQATEGCNEGSEGCSCYGNGTCDEKLVCGPNKLCEPPSDNTTGTTTGNTTTNTTGNVTNGATGDSTGDTSGKTTGDTTTNSTSSTAGTSTGDSDGSTGSSTGDGEPGCGNVPADMACVPANTFEMGTNLNTFQASPIPPNEKPAHQVTITKSFWMDKTEVTVEAYATCWALKFCDLPMQGPSLNWGVAGKEKHPANGVNWYQAKKYCEWKGKRLPTEAEWELAARGTDGRMYPWGDDPPTCEHAVSDYCGTKGTGAVGSKPLGVSPYGLYDMGGNVLEWCSDYYKEDYYYQSPDLDPQGPIDGTQRVLRSFGVFPFKPDPTLRATLRGSGSPLGNDANPAVLGFRCAQTPS